MTATATAPTTAPTEAAARELRFAAGLPGFPGATRFTVVPWGGPGSPFSVLESADVEGLAFVVVPPALFFPAYEPELDRATAERLGLTCEDDAELLVILTLGESAADATANLLGPVVANRRTGEALQAVLAGQPWSSRTPLTGG